MRTPASESNLAASIPELLHEARGGSQEAMGRLLEHARPSLELQAEFSWPRRFWRYLGPDDLVQEICKDAHASFQDFKGNTEAEWLGWLREGLRNDMVSARRKLLAQKRQANRTVSLQGVGTDEDDPLAWLIDSSTPGRKAIRAESVGLLAKALAQLPADYRQVIWLRNFEGWTFPEVGELMGRTADAARQLWYRAIERLRELLGGSNEPP